MTMTDTPTPSASPEPEAAATAPRGRRQQAKPGPRAPRKVHPVLEKLFTLYPGLFGARFLPLKRGIFQELLAAHPEAFAKDELKVALALHTRSTRYLEAVASGRQRHDLQGQAVEPVAPEHVHHAILEVFKRQQTRGAQDARPQALKRIAAAIDGSGLSPQDYGALVRGQDETANALLDEALADAGARSAKAEALLRAFTASGKSETEFADMYGMEPEEVAQTLARARR